MTYKRLCVFLEGNDDERFFESIVKPILSPQYDLIQIWQYAQKPRRRTKNFLRAIKAMNSDYFFFVDINNLPCVTSKKENIGEEYGEIIDLNKIIVVVREIESWYLAGVNYKNSRGLRIRNLRNTCNITKEQFNSLIPKQFDSRIDFMIEILKRFSIQTAKKKNKSFGYFMGKI